MIKLRRRLVLQRCPRFSSIHGEAGATVIGVADAIGILWIDPQTVMIAVAGGKETKRFCSVNGFERASVQHINGVGRFGVRINLAEIPGALTKTAVVVHFCPFLATVFRAINTALFCFDNRVNAIRIGAGNSNANFAENAFR